MRHYRFALSSIMLLAMIASAYAQSSLSIGSSYEFVSPGGVLFDTGTLSLQGGSGSECLQASAGVVALIGSPCGNANIGSVNIWTALQTFNANQLALAGVTGSTQCLQASSSGIVGGTGGPCGSGSGAVNSVSNSDGTLTITPTTGAVVASLNLAKANTWSAVQSFPAGTVASPSVLIGANIGFSAPASSEFALSVGGVSKLDYNITHASSWNLGFNTFVNGSLTASSGVSTSGNIVGSANTSELTLGSANDTVFARQAAGVFEVSTSTTANSNGRLLAAAYFSGGTSPTLTTGTCSGSSAVGGSTAGTFSAAACSAGTYILSGLPTAPNGYFCSAVDHTTPLDTLSNTASTTTSCTLTGTTASADVIAFQAMGY